MIRRGRVSSGLSKKTLENHGASSSISIVIPKDRADPIAKACPMVRYNPSVSPSACLRAARVRTVWSRPIIPMLEKRSAVARARRNSPTPSGPYNLPSTIKRMNLRLRTTVPARLIRAPRTISRVSFRLVCVSLAIGKSLRCEAQPPFGSDDI